MNQDDLKQLLLDHYFEYASNVQEALNCLAYERSVDVEILSPSKFSNWLYHLERRIVEIKHNGLTRYFGFIYCPYYSLIDYDSLKEYELKLVITTEHKFVPIK